MCITCSQVHSTSSILSNKHLLSFLTNTHIFYLIQQTRSPGVLEVLHSTQSTHSRQDQRRMLSAPFNSCSCLCS